MRPQKVLSGGIRLVCVDRDLNAVFRRLHGDTWVIMRLLRASFKSQVIVDSHLARLGTSQSGLTSSICSRRLSRRRLMALPGPNVSPPPPVSIPPSSASSSRVNPVDLGAAWKYSEAIAVGIGGEWVRLMCEGFDRQPAALKGAVLRKVSLMVMRRSPTPSATSLR